jgi:hypothetical protein
MSATACGTRVCRYNVAWPTRPTQIDYKHQSKLSVNVDRSKVPPTHNVAQNLEYYTDSQFVVLTVCTPPIVIDDGQVDNNSGNNAPYTNDMDDSMRTPLATPPRSRCDHLSTLHTPSITLPTRRVINEIDGEFVAVVSDHAPLNFTDHKMTNLLAVSTKNLPVK